jgi:hypothetical protein
MDAVSAELPSKAVVTTTLSPLSKQESADVFSHVAATNRAPSGVKA